MATISKEIVPPGQAELLAQWIARAEFPLNEGVGRAISANMQEYREEGPNDDLAKLVVNLFSGSNAAIERWPLKVRVLLNQTKHETDNPFETWARPRDLEKRKLAISTWSNMLSFIVRYWTFDCRELERMGLFLSEDMKHILENIDFWLKLGKNPKRIKDAISEFFTLAIMDPEPSVRTNPVLWWLVVLIQSQIFDKQPKLPLGGIDKGTVPCLDFRGNLEAMNHYARVLILETAVKIWKPKDPQSAERALSYVNDSHQHSNWVNEDAERPEVSVSDENDLLSAPAWQDFLAHLQSLVTTWLADDCKGPIREILALLEGHYVTRDREDVPSIITPQAQQVNYEYEAKLEIWEDFARGLGGYCMGLGHPATTGAHSCGTCETATAANQAARRAIENEFGEEENFLQWDEMVREDGTIKISAICIDDANNSKARAWVEKKRR